MRCRVRGLDVIHRPSTEYCNYAHVIGSCAGGSWDRYGIDTDCDDDVFFPALNQVIFDFQDVYF